MCWEGLRIGGRALRDEPREQGGRRRHAELPAVQELLGEHVPDLGLVADNFQVGCLQQVFLAVEDGLANIRLDLRFAQLMLPAAFLGQELDQVVAVADADGAGKDLLHLEFLDRFLELGADGLHLLLGDESQVPAPRGGLGVLGVLHRQAGKILAVQQPPHQKPGLFLGLGGSGGVVAPGIVDPGLLGIRYENVGEAPTLGEVVVGLVLFEVLLDLGLGHRDLGGDLLVVELLDGGSLAQSLFELLLGDPLLLEELLKLLLGVVLLEVGEPGADLGIAGGQTVGGGHLHEDLIVDELAQDVELEGGSLLGRRRPGTLPELSVEALVDRGHLDLGFIDDGRGVGAHLGPRAAASSNQEKQGQSRCTVSIAGKHHGISGHAGGPPGTAPLETRHQPSSALSRQPAAESGGTSPSLAPPPASDNTVLSRRARP